VASFAKNLQLSWHCRDSVYNSVSDAAKKKAEQSTAAGIPLAAACTACAAKVDSGATHVVCESKMGDRPKATTNMFSGTFSLQLSNSLSLDSRIVR
jgi:hypothetical protein